MCTAEGKNKPYELRNGETSRFERLVFATLDDSRLSPRVVATLGIIATGGKVAFLLGLILLIILIISVGAHMAVATIVTDAKNRRSRS